MGERGDGVTVVNQRPVERHRLLISCERCVKHLTQAEYPDQAALLEAYPSAKEVAVRADLGATAIWFLRVAPMLAAVIDPDHQCPPWAERQAAGRWQYPF